MRIAALRDPPSGPLQRTKARFKPLSAFDERFAHVKNGGTLSRAAGPIDLGLNWYLESVSSTLGGRYRHIATSASGVAGPTSVTNFLDQETRRSLLQEADDLRFREATLAQRSPSSRGCRFKTRAYTAHQQR